MDKNKSKKSVDSKAKIKTFKPSIPTASDSLALLKSTQDVNKYYTGNNYKKYEGSLDSKDVHAKNKNIRTQLNANNPRVKVREKNGNVPIFNRSLKNDEYYKKIDDNKYTQREQQYDILDLAAPSPVYDNRIQPHSQNTFINNNKKDSLYGDNVSLPMYDELAITPALMLSEAQYNERLLKYGSKGLPSKYKGSGTSLPTSPFTPNIPKPIPQRLNQTAVTGNSYGVNETVPSLELSRKGMKAPSPKGYNVTDTYGGDPFGARKSQYKVGYDDSFSLPSVNNNSTTRTMTPYFAEGGKLNQPLNNNTLNEFNEGGSHEENPLGGIPQGTGANGLMNTVEQGETKKGDFIYSDRIQIPKGRSKEIGMSINVDNKTFAAASKQINNMFKDRTDPISMSTKNNMLDKLAETQETLKQEQELKQQNIQEAMMLNSQEVPDMMDGEIPQGFEEFSKGGSLSEPDPYREWMRKHNLKESDDYNLRRAYELNYEPDEQGHLPTVDSETLQFLKKSNHPTLKSEEDWFNSTAEDAVEFKSKHELDKTTTKDYWQYKPKQNQQFGGGFGSLAGMFGNSGTGAGGINVGAIGSALNTKSSMSQTSPQKSSSAMDNSKIGGILGGLGDSLGGVGSFGKQQKLNEQDGFYDPKLAKDQQGEQMAGTVKDTVASAFGPIGQFWRGIQKAGKGIGDSIGGDAGAAVSGIFSPEEATISNLTNSDMNIGEKLLGTVPGLGAVMANKAAKKRQDKFLTEKRKGDFFKEYVKPSMNDDNVKVFKNGGNLNRIPPVDGSLQGYVDNDLGLSNQTRQPLTPITPNSSGRTYENPLTVDTRERVGFKDSDTQTNKFNIKDKLKSINPDMSFLRYSPVASNMRQLSRLANPEVESLSRINRGYQKQFLDEATFQNQAKEQTAGAINAIGRSGVSNGQLINATLAAQLNGTRAIGEGYNQIKQHNINEEKTRQSLLLNNDQFNAQQSNLEKDINARNRSAFVNNRSKLESAIGNDLGNIGKEEVYKKLAVEATGYTWDGKYYTNGKDKLTPEQYNEKLKNVEKAKVENDKLNNSHAKGGKLGSLKFKM